MAISENSPGKQATGTTTTVTLRGIDPVAPHQEWDFTASNTVYSDPGHWIVRGDRNKTMPMPRCSKATTSR